MPTETKSEEKSLFIIGKNSMPSFSSDEARETFRSDLIKDINSIREQLRRARHNKKNKKGFVEGSPEFIDWERRIKSCWTIKDIHLRLVNLQLEKLDGSILTKKEDEIRLISDIRAIRNQIKYARISGRNVAGVCFGTPEYEDWEEKAQSCKEIKEEQLQNLRIDLGKLDTQRIRRLYIAERQQADIFAGAINDVLDYIETLPNRNDEEIRHIYTLLDNANNAAGELQSE